MRRSAVKSRSGEWIGVDLDGTLACYDGWKGIEHVGEPVPGMLARVKAWLVDGVEVRIVTARVSHHFTYRVLAATHIQEWCEKYIGRKLDVTCCKDFAMIELWDDRAVQVQHNSGEPVLGYVSKAEFWRLM